MSSPSNLRLPRLVIVLCTIVALGVPVSARAQSVIQAGTAAPKPFEALSNSAHSIRDSIVSMARAQLGKKYKRGGTTPTKGFDCSGLIKYVMTALQSKPLVGVVP